MKLLSGEVPDQYYAVTARLAALGYQRATMRVIAGCILALGLPAMLAAGNPLASNIAGGRALLAVVPLACLALAGPWLRYRWPTRSQSITVVVAGSLFLAAGCSVVSNPFSGLLVATAFPFILGYAALFHGTRPQAFAAIVATGTILWLTIRIATTDVPTALAVATPVILINVAVLVACRIITEVNSYRSGPHDIDPLTGLLTRESFNERTATLLGARNRDDDRYLVVTLVAIDSFSMLRDLRGGRGADGARVAVGQALRETVRHDAVIGHVGDAEFLVADTFTTSDPTPLAERIRGAVAATPDRPTTSMGVVCTPLAPLADRPPEEVLDELIALATTAMYRARRRGGNVVEYVLEPNLDTD